MTTRLTFSPGNHSYYLADPDTGKKQRIPSVTTLLNLLAKPQLVKWAARTAAEYAADEWETLHSLPVSERIELIKQAPNKARDSKAAKGTAIHALAEDLLAGKSVEVPADIAASVQGLANWWDTAQMRRIHAEARVWSEEDPESDLCAYAGTLDLLVDCPNRGVGLVDIKTGSAPWPDQAVQLAAYAGAHYLVVDDEDTVMPTIDWLGILRVHPDGTTLHVVDRESRWHSVLRFELLRSLRSLPAAGFQEAV